jgi:hypothetical protein
MEKQLLVTNPGFSLDDLVLEVRSAGGRPTLLFPPSHLIAYLPAAASLKAGLPFAAASLSSLSTQARSAVQAFARGQQMVPQAPEVPVSWDAPGKQPPRQRGDSAAVLDRPLPGLMGAPIALSTGTPTSRYLVGRVAVALVIVSRERGTAAQPNPEHLTREERDTAATEASQALEWLAGLEPRALVEFVFERNDIEITVVPDSRTPNTFEDREAVWRDPALRDLNLPAGRDGYSRLARDVRDRNSAQWGVVIFVTRYSLHHFAYAADERLVQHFDNDGWGVANLHRVIAHETCHLFGAQDEYASSNCDCTTKSGELQVENGNCESCAADPVDCLMNANTLAMCDFTKGQIGWRAPLLAGGRVLIAGFATGTLAAQYWEDWGTSHLLDGWHDDDDDRLVGDFLGLGHDQVMFFNKSDAGDGRVLIADFSAGHPPATALYWENWGQSLLLNGWQDANDARLVGDFLALGYDQVMFINETDAGDGRILVSDFKAGHPPATVRYWENWGQSPLLNGWQDANDDRLVGDFLGLGYDQVMFLNMTDAGDGRILIADFSSGHPPATVRYWESWGQSAMLDSWQDANDDRLVGDFLGLGYDQVIFFNQTDSGDGRMLIADFKSGGPPATVRYWESWDQSAVLNGWQDAGDLRFVGDFMALGYDQILFINRQNAGDGRVLVADFKSGQPPATVRFLESWGQSPVLDGWHDANDLVLAGTLMGSQCELMFINRDRP